MEDGESVKDGSRVKEVCSLLEELMITGSWLQFDFMWLG